MKDIKEGDIVRWKRFDSGENGGELVGIVLKRPNVTISDTTMVNVLGADGFVYRPYLRELQLVSHNETAKEFIDKAVEEIQPRNQFHIGDKVIIHGFPVPVMVRGYIIYIGDERALVWTGTNTFYVNIANMKKTDNFEPRLEELYHSLIENNGE